MKLELKKVKISLSQSEETTAFTGQLFINGQYAADVSNAGHGGANRIFSKPFQTELIKQAETYCKTLPSVHDEGMDLPMNLEFWISLEVGKIQNEKEIEKKQKKYILVGDHNGELCAGVKLPKTIEEILKLPIGMDFLKESVERVKKQLKPGQRILNTNIPNELL